MGGPRPYMIVFEKLDGEECPFFMCINCRMTITAMDEVTARIYWKDFERPHFIILHDNICAEVYFKKNRIKVETIQSRPLNTFLDLLNYNTRQAVPLSPWAQLKSLGKCFCLFFWSGYYGCLSNSCPHQHPSKSAPMVLTTAMNTRSFNEKGTQKSIT